MVPASSPPPAMKEFRCTWGTCTKSFSRAEHLHRHALNHNEDTGTECHRCAAVFKRKDLLDRHMARHKEKDNEAGGEGLGKLLTRKRLWRDSTGQIVAKRRPEHEKRNRISVSSSQSGRMSNDHAEAGDSHQSPDLNNSASSQTGPLLSPPGSHSMSESVSGIENPENAHAADSTEQWPISMDDPTPTLPLQDLGVDSYDFLCNAAWGSQSLQATNPGAALPFDDMFAPDTASSFNMPFTTPNYYNWLFESEPWPTTGLESIGHDNPGSAPFSDPFSKPHQSYIPLKPRQERPISGLAHLLNDPEGVTSRVFQDSPPPSHSTYSTGVSSMTSDFSSSSYSPTSGHGGPSSADFPVMSRNNDYQRSQSKTLRRLPIINKTARENILRLIDQAHPKNPDGTEITRDHHLLSLEILQQYLDLFFTGFNVSYPLLHQASFDPADANALLLASVLVLGATYSKKEDHLFAICIHNTMRAQIFESAAFTTRPTLWMLQTILLVECFGKSRAGQLQHDMSHLFHGLLINLIRRSDCQSARCQPFTEDDGIHYRWRAEVDAEQKRRLALLCFMWDTQHAVLFSQSLCMNAAELKLTLPWDPELWEADTPEEWHSLNSKAHSQSQYLSVLKTYINHRSTTRTPSLNALSRVLMLHGLMSVAWDLNRRDQTSLGLTPAAQKTSWQTRLSHAYDTWKADFEQYTRSTLQAIPSSEQESFQRFSTSNLAIYHAAQIILQVEIIDLQIYAGASHIIGRPVTQTDRERSKKQVEKWARNGSEAAPLAIAASHAARLLRDGARKLKDWDAGDVFHYPWTLYLSTLTIWSFQINSKRPAHPLPLSHSLTPTNTGMNSGSPFNPVNSPSTPSITHEDGDEEGDWDSKAEMNALVSAMARSNMEELKRVAARYRTRDLPQVMGRLLSGVRWAVVQEGVIVLRGLGGRDR